MPRLRRVRPRTVVQDQGDRLSALPEELIRLILSSLDTRSALSTAVLGRRWARLPRDLPAYNFRVSDILPPEYDRTVALRRRNLPRNTVQARVLDGLMASCEVSAIRAFEDGITSFLEADARRCVKTLRLEFFHTNDGGRIVDNLIAHAVGAKGVQDLEVVVRPASQEQEEQPSPAPAYSFPHHRLKDGHRSCLHTLTIGNCTLPPRLHCYHALTKLVLRDMPVSTPVGVYERVLSECNQLQVLHLMSCSCDEDRLVVCSAALRELVVEACSFMVIQLQDLPMLSHLACLTNTVELVFGSVPCLTHTNLTFFVEEDILVFPPLPHHHDQLNHFLAMSPTMANLVIRFPGPKMWIGPNKLHMPLLHLKRLLVADLPSNWDVSWTRTLLMAAPSLEVLHINVAHSELPETYGILWSIYSQIQCHPQMRELVTRLQMQFLKYVVAACTSLQRLVLLKDGHVRYNGLWDWDMVRGLQGSHWRDHDKRLLRRLIKSGPSPSVELTVG